MKNMLRLALVLVFCVTLLLCLAPGASAESGTWGSLSWTLDSSGTLTISGNGVMDDFTNSSTAAWRAYSGWNRDISAVRIEKGVTSIGENAFSGFVWGLKSITISDSVKFIGAYAFSNCKELQSITLPSSVTYIGKMAFYNCENLTSIIIPSSVTSIESQTFDGCYSLRNVTISNGVTDIDSYAFRSCKELISVTLPNSVTSIGKHAFYNCDKLTSITIPNSVTSIGMGPFSACDSLQNIFVDPNNSTYCDLNGVLYNYKQSEILCYPGGRTGAYSIPNSVTEIGDDAFLYCENLTRIMIPNSVKRIKEGSFKSSGLKSIEIPDSVTFIGYEAFAYCNELTSISIPNSVTYIEGEAFEHSGLTSVTIPDSLNTIRYSTFSGCSRLTSVTIPKSVKTIESGAFFECNMLASVYYSGTQEQWNKISIAEKNDPLLNAILIKRQFIKYIDWNGIEQTVYLPNSIEEYIFQTDSAVYNPELAYYLMLLANAAYDSDCIHNSLESLGFPDYTILTSDDYQDEERYANYTFAKKELPDGRLLVMITVRGTHGLTEWLRTDFNLGISTGPRVHKGFSDSSDNMISSLQGYLGNIPTSNVVYVFSGHSLGAAVANLTAVRLQSKGVPRANIYDYNFACPDVAKEHFAGLWKNPNDMYSNVFNISDARDLVSYVPGVLGNVVEAYVKRHLLQGDSAYTWGKFGLSRWFSYDWDNIGEVEYNPTTHYGDNYIYYLHTYQPFSTYKTYEEVKVHRSIDRVASRIKVICGFCPVNIIIYDNSGNPVASVIDDVVEYYSSNFGEVIIYTEDDMKVIALPNGQDYDVQFVATDEGTMSYEVLDADLVTGDIYEEKTFDSVAISPGKTLVSNVGGNTDTEEVKLYVVNNENVPVKEVHEDGTEDTLIASGKWGELVWALDDEGILTISGKGEMLPLGRETINQYGNSDYEPIGEAWQDYRSSIREVILFEGITNISDLAFYDCKQLSSITLPESLLSIGKHAFSYCNNLLEITIPSSVKQIDDYAFSLCSGFSHVTIPDGVSTLGKYAFLFCENLESIVLPDSMTIVDDATFFGCKNLSQIRLPNDLQYIGTLSFCSCSYLESILIPDSVTIIDYGAFQNCTSLSNVFFSGTQEQWARVIISDYNEALNAASRHFRPNPDFILPNALTKIGDEAFAGGVFTYVKLSEKTEKIGENAFANCPNLAYIYIPAATTQIDAQAFGNMQNLTILGISGSTAEDYAINHGFIFKAVSLDDSNAVTISFVCGSDAFYLSVPGLGTAHIMGTVTCVFDAGTIISITPIEGYGDAVNVQSPGIGIMTGTTVNYTVPSMNETVTLTAINNN